MRKEAFHKPEGGPGGSRIRICRSSSALNSLPRRVRRAGFICGELDQVHRGELQRPCWRRRRLIEMNADRCEYTVQAAVRAVNRCPIILLAAWLAGCARF